MQTTLDISALDDFLELVLEKEAFAARKKPAPPEKKDKEQFKAVQKREIDLWHHWNNNGRKAEHLKPIYESFKPLLQREANKFRSIEIPKSAINAEIRKQFVNAIKTYDPKRAQLNSWITTNIQKSSRFIKTYQNLGKIPEGQISKIREYKQARETLFNKLGYEPDTQTIADHLKWPRKRVAQLQKELRSDLSASGFPTDPAEVFSPKELEAVRILQFDNRLSKDERSVYEYTFGINGKPRLQPGQIAKQTGLHPSKVSRIRSKIKDYVQEAIEVL